MATTPAVSNDATPSAPVSGAASTNGAAAPVSTDGGASVSADAAAPAGGGQSLLAAADTGKRDGAPEAKPSDSKPTDVKPADAKPADAKPEFDAAAKPAETAPTEAKPAEAKPADAKPADADAKPADALPTEAPAPPVYDAWKLPENVQLDDGRVTKFNTLLAETELATKADHTLMSGLGQKLIDFYLEDRQQLANDALKYQQDVWNRHKERLIGELKADPELGGNRLETSLGNAKYAFESFFGLKADQQQKLMAVLDAGGISDHPLFIRALNNIFERFREPEPVQPNLPGAPANSRGQRNWYDKVDGQTAQ